MSRIAIVGGGAAGMMCAALLIENGYDVTLFEKNDKCGRKLAITGKGRCNVTNNCSPSDFVKNIPTNPSFLYSSVNRFAPSDTIDFFENHGVPLKTERGNRVFPQSDSAYSIVDALYGVVKKKTVFRTVSGLVCENGRIRGITAGGKEYYYDAVVVATGGRSYPLTGSTGDGYRFAEELGIEVTPPKPSLIPLVSPSKDCPKMMGLSLKNVEISLFKDGKKIYGDFGEMMFTHFGLTGPVILSSSAYIDGFKDHRYSLSIDLKPALDEKKLDERLLRDFSENINRNFANSLSALLPSKMIPVFVDRTGIDPEKKINSVTKEERAKIVSLLKDFRFEITGTRPIDEAIITRGGVSVKELNPKTMESKKVSGLYFIGEVIDVDGYTGGFNLQ
ncbi:MAG: NAD(P)/FAD-dependent oxidoreductase, partial [Firmicutes bacterium]|nr:NAD(P)/FAD-dependent oxidoreductase [Candidatus Colimorpha enterica]